MQEVGLERLRSAAGAKISGTSEESPIVIFERFDVCGRMKNAGQERFLIVVILLLVSLAGLSDISAFAADQRHQVKVGKKGDVTFQVETRVGAFTLKPGRYFIRHRVAGGDHFIQFTEVTKGQGKNVGGFSVSPPVEVKCRLRPTERRVRGTVIIFANSEAGIRQIETVLVSGEDVAHDF